MKPERFLFLLLCSVPQVGLAGPPPACPAVDEASRVHLADYVRKKYKLPEAAQIHVTEIAFVEGSCFRKLQFAADRSQRPFKVELTLSPDLRFLTRELFDSRIDPAEEERQKVQVQAARLSEGAAASFGAGDAPVTLVVFSDFQCPFCSQMARGLKQEILPAAGDKVRVIFRNFPLAMHPWARSAAEAMACARAQNQDMFWPLHDYLFAHQRDLTADNLLARLSEQASAFNGFSASRFSQCVEKKEMASEVDQDVALGTEMKVEGTPTLFINGQRIVGYRVEEIQTLIREQAAGESGPK